MRAFFFLAINLSALWLGGAVQAQGWGAEPAYERIRFDGVSHAPNGLLAGNTEVRASRWAGFVSADPALYALRRVALPGGPALLRDGRVIRFYPGWGVLPGGRSSGDMIEEIRLYSRADVSPYFDSVINADRGIFPPLPRRVPDFPGYEHRQSASVLSGGYIGIWRRSRGRPGTLIAAYLDRDDAPSPAVLGRTTINYGTIAAAVPCGAFAFTITTEARPGQPVYLIRYDWRPTPQSSGGLLRPRAPRALPC